MLGFNTFRHHVIYKTKQQIRTLKLSWPCKKITLYDSIMKVHVSKDCETCKALKNMRLQDHVFLKDHSQL